MSMKCKVCGEELRPRNPPTAPAQFGDKKYDLNEKRETNDVKKVVTRCNNWHLQIVYFDWDSMKYVKVKK